MMSATSMVLDLVEGWEVGSEVDRGDYFCLLVYVPGTSVWYMVKGGGGWWKVGSEVDREDFLYLLVYVPGASVKG